MPLPQQHKPYCTVGYDHVGPCMFTRLIMGSTDNPVPVTPAPAGPVNARAAAEEIADIFGLKQQMESLTTIIEKHCGAASVQLQRAALIAESRGIDLETAQELVWLRDENAALRRQLRAGKPPRNKS